MRNLVVLAISCAVLAPAAREQDIASGPDKGVKVSAVKVFDVTGAYKDKNVDYAEARKGKPTVYLFINAEKFDRPMNRFMKTLDGVVMKDFEDAYVVAVWVNGDADKVKEMLPRVQQSVQYEATALTLFTGDKEGPKGWHINGDAHLTAVVTNDGKVAAAFGFQSLNETNVPMVKAALASAIKKK